MTLLADINSRNAQKWRSIQDYAEYHMTHYLRSKSPAISIDIDATIFNEISLRIMDNCLTTIEHLSSHGWTIFLITNRCESTREETIEQLEINGISRDLYAALFMRSSNRISRRTKREHRARVRDDFSLEIAIGDQLEDLIAESEDDETPHRNILMETLCLT